MQKLRQGSNWPFSLVIWSFPLRGCSLQSLFAVHDAVVGHGVADYFIDRGLSLQDFAPSFLAEREHAAVDSGLLDLPTAGAGIGELADFVVVDQQLVNAHSPFVSGPAAVA